MRSLKSFVSEPPVATGLSNDARLFCQTVRHSPDRMDLSLAVLRRDGFSVSLKQPCNWSAFYLIEVRYESFRVQPAEDGYF